MTIQTFMHLGLALISTVSGASIRGGRRSLAANDEQFRPPSNRFLLTNERRLLAHEGVMRTLIIRVTDADGNSPITDARRQSDAWFGTYDLDLAQNQNSMAGLYDQCSGGKLVFVPATGPGVIDGVLEITVNHSMSRCNECDPPREPMHIGDAGRLVRNEFNRLNQDLGIQFEAYSMIMPIGVKGSGGLARQGGDHNMFTSGADRSLELVIHEFGHNLGLHHSGVPEGEDDDDTCMMGCCKGAQQMCFNAAKSWYSGWYTEEGKDGYHDASFETPGQWWKGSLVGIGDYLNNLFDDQQHRVVVKMNSLFMMFNRKKGVNSGVKAYGDEIVVVQQWGEGGKSMVLAHLNLDESDKRFVVSRDVLHTDFDIVVEVCAITFQPVVTGPQITGGTASQSSTSANAVAERAIDGNLDQTWAGGSVTHTSGEDFNPWWKWTLDQPEEIGHVRIYNRADCCGDRLSNAILELVSDEGEVVFKRNLGTAEVAKELFLGDSYLTKEVKISLQGDKILSLAEVQVFGPSDQQRLPDSAQVIAYASDGSQSINCDTTSAPTTSHLPSASPSVSIQPTIYRAVPRDVVLLRDDSSCVLQSNPNNHPDRFKCMLQPTASSALPGGYDNEDVVLVGKDGCLIIVQPVTWAWAGNAFIFQSVEGLDVINACFNAKTLITENVPTVSPSLTPFAASPTAAPTTPSSTGGPIVAPTNNPATASPTGSPNAAPTNKPTNNPTTASRTGAPSAAPTNKSTNNPTASPTAETVPGDTVLLRDRSPCIFQSNLSNHPDRFKCMVEPTTPNSEPGVYGADPVALRGNSGCLLIIQPVTWAWEGNAFIFQSSDSLDTINKCFAPGELITQSSPTATPSIAPSVSIIPPDVVLQRDDSPCIFQSNLANHPDRFKCMVEPTTHNSEPGGYGSDVVWLKGNGGCIIAVQPVTWAWEGNAFIFQSSDSLDTINQCFPPGELITQSNPIATPSIAPSVSIIPPHVHLQRDDTPCIFQSNPANHPDRFKCMVEPTTHSSEPGGYGNDTVWLKGNGGCIIAVQPVTWAWDGNTFIFQSSESLATINECFGAGTLITGHRDTEETYVFD